MSVSIIRCDSSHATDSLYLPEEKKKIRTAAKTEVAVEFCQALG